jgi:hypothetical protein
MSRPNALLARRGPGLTPFLLAAALLHGGLALYRRGTPLALPSPSTPTEPEAVFELSLETASTDANAASPGATPSPAAPTDGRLALSENARPAPRAPAEPPRTPTGEGAAKVEKVVPSPRGEIASAEPASSAGGEAPGSASAGEAPRAINFSLGKLPSSWGAPAPEASSRVAPPPDPAARVAQELRRAQDDHDKELGLGWTGNVINALSTTEIRNSAPPGEGTARVEVEFGGDGRPKSTRIVSGTGGASSWQRLAELLAASLMRKPPAGLAGGRGARITVEVRLTERLPSGAAPGGNYSVKPCGVGVCAGAEFDLSDIGAKVIRIMRASIVQAERL